MDVKEMSMFVVSIYFGFSNLHSFASLLLVETQILTQQNA